MNLNAKPKIVELLAVKDSEYQSIKIFRGEKIKQDSLFDIFEKSRCVKDALESVFKMDLIVEEMGLTFKESESQTFFSANLKASGNINFLKSVSNTLAKNLNIYSKRLENECQIFSETIAVGFFALEQIIMNKELINRNDLQGLIQIFDSISKTHDKLNITVLGIKYFKKKFSQLQFDFEDIKNAKYTMSSVLDFLLNEFIIGRSIVENLKYKIGEIIKAKN